MRLLTATVLSAKNAQSNSSPWFYLVDIEVSDILTARYVRNTEPVVFNGVTYSPAGLTIDTIKTDARGGLNEVQITVPNLTREVSAYVLQNEMRGRRVILTEVYSGGPNDAESYVDSSVYRINEISGDERVVIFKLGHPPLLVQRFPNSRFWRNDCRFAYKTDPGCGFVDGAMSGDGLLNWDAGNSLIVGTNTKFTQRFIGGDSLRVRGVDVAIQSVLSNTSIRPVSPPANLPWSNETYTLVKPTCTNQLTGPNGCKAHKNQERFGGFWGIPSSLGGL